MINKSHHYIMMLSIGLCLVAAKAALACSVPVFRYALERWIPDDYQIELVSQQKEGTAITSVEKMLNSSDINAKIQINNNAPSTIHRSGELRLFLPASCGISHPIWTAPLSTNATKVLLHSPIRTEIAEKILSGDSVVWLLLKSGNEKADAQAEKLITKELAHSQETIQLPEIEPSDTMIAQSPGRAPLKIAFSLLTLARDNRSEIVLINALLNSNPQLLHGQKEPMVFPICGAGRAFPPLVGNQISKENINRVCQFLTGECSCEIKGQNPGFDLPISTNWGAPACQTLYTEISLPPLTGVLPKQEPATNITNSGTKATSTAPSATPPKKAPLPTDNRAYPIGLLAVITIGALGFIVIIGSFIIAGKTSLNND